MNMRILSVCLLLPLCTTAAFAESQFAYWEMKGMKEQDVNAQITCFVNAIKVWGEADSKESLVLTYALLGSAYLELGAADNALESANRALKLGKCKSTQLAYSIRGMAYGIKHRYEKGISDLTAALALSPHEASINANLCITYAEAENYEKALVFCDNAVKFGPDNIENFTDRGHIYVELGEIDRGLKEFQKAMERVSDTDSAKNLLNSGMRYKSLVYTRMGNAYFKKKDFKAALENYKSAIRISSRNAEAYWRRGMLYSAAGEDALAQKDFDQAIILDLDCVEAYNGRGYLFFKKKEYGAALQDFNRALAITSLPSARLHRALCYLALKRYKSALSDLDKFFAAKSGTPEAYNARGEAYRGTGEREFALDDFNTACRLGSKQGCLNAKSGRKF
ncbi:MAG: tetratricopeptide repeat protein [Elusimicrobia bacterium]|nr:tetratricopeptide repeat protein [Elusimicrobiota bacterium]